jgi:hypothetical protein
MTAMNPASNAKNPGHRWSFFRAGGFDQVHLNTGADLMSLERLDQKLWVTLSCPTNGLEFDTRTLEMIDRDGDGRIRVPEIIEAVNWAGSILKDPDDLTRGSSVLPLSAINDQSFEGKKLLSSAKQILISLGKADSTEITIDDMANAAEMVAQTRFNGDGIIPADAADDAAIGRIIGEIIDCLGPEKDKSGKPGISQDKLDQFFTDARVFSEWWREAESNAGSVFPLGEATIAAVASFTALRDKAEDYFTRCRLAAFDTRALSALNRQEEEYIAVAKKILSPSLEEISGFPLARIEAHKALPLKEGVNPAWMTFVAAFEEQVVKPLLADKADLTEAEWENIKAKFSPYCDWLSRKAGGTVEKLGIRRVREILNGNSKEMISDLIARDRALESEFSSVASVEKLIHYYRDLSTLLNNFVSFSDFFTRKKKAIFQAGTLYLDGRSCELCVRVEDIDKHASLAALSRIYLTYCDCTRKGGTERMTIAAAFTGGDSDYLMVGRNGVFYDRKGQDWDATIVRVMDNPISIRQAFWSPYKQLAQMISRQIGKLAAARDKAVMEKAATKVAETGQKLAAGQTAAAAPAPPFDVAKFAGIFAAIGLAVGFIGTAIVSVVTGFFKLAWWQMPLVVVGLMLIISAPPVILAWLKLRQRTLGPILDANGWAVNARVRINVAFGSSLTKVATLPDGAVRSLEDPFADKKRKWPKVVILLIILLALLYFLYDYGALYKWITGMFGHRPQ